MKAHDQPPLKKITEEEYQALINQPTVDENKEKFTISEDINSITFLRILAWLVIAFGIIIAIVLFVKKLNEIDAGVAISGIYWLYIIIPIISSVVTGTIMLVFAGIAENVKNNSK